jgi:hypothetical protein
MGWLSSRGWLSSKGWGGRCVVSMPHRVGRAGGLADPAATLNLTLNLTLNRP